MRGAGGTEGGAQSRGAGGGFSFSLGSWGKGRPRALHAGLCSAACWRVERPGGAAAAHGWGRVTISSLADLPWNGGRWPHSRGTLCATPHPPPFRKQWPGGNSPPLQSVSPTKFPGVEHLWRRGRSSPTGAGWLGRVLPGRAQPGAGDPPCLRGEARMELCTGPGSPRLALAEPGAASFTLDPGGQQQVLPRLFHHPASTCGLPSRRARRGPRLAWRSPWHVPRHPKSLRGPRWAPRSRRNARGALPRCPVWSPSSSPPRGRTHLPVFCRDRRPFCWEPLSWRPSGGLVASVPRAGWKVANTKARVMNWPSRAAHMVVRVNLPPRDLESLCSPRPSPPPSLLPLLLPLSLLSRLFLPPPPRSRRSDRGYPAPSRSSPESM